jgi:hypothetical protein
MIQSTSITKLGKRKKKQKKENAGTIIPSKVVLLFYQEKVGTRLKMKISKNK